MTVKVKICGIRSMEAAQTAISGGADFLGLNFVPTSKRYVDREIAKQIAHFAKGKIALVGVFKNASGDQVNRIAEELQLDFVQLHGEENKHYMKKMIRPVIKSVHDTHFEKEFDTGFLLLDRKEQGKGDMYDLQTAKRIAEQYDIFFSGGLNPDNIISVIEKVKPYAVDVASGIETNGQQDLDKIKKFVKNAKGVTI